MQLFNRYVSPRGLTVFGCEILLIFGSVAIAARAHGAGGAARLELGRLRGHPRRGALTRRVELRAMDLIALSDAWKASIALISDSLPWSIPARAYTPGARPQGARTREIPGA